MSTDDYVLLCKSGKAGRWPEDKDPSGWWMSEKLDGLRARWDGKQFFSRNRNPFPVPSYFSKGFPSIEMDGELWLGYHRFEETSSIVRNGSEDRGWGQMTYRVFDIPNPKLGSVEDRWAALKKAVSDANLPNLVFVPQIKCLGQANADSMMQEILAKKGEGLMFRQPGSSYQEGRSGSILKMKDFIDDEATIIGYEQINVKTDIKAHLKNAVGKFVCRSGKLFNGQIFKVGSGLTDAMRLNPPPVGSLITFRYQELTGKKGVPRHARFVTVRDYE
jgi:DNA ligase 1